MLNLGDRHKQALRFLVSAVREGKLQSEFQVIWANNNSGIITTEDEEQVAIPGASPLTLDLLEREGLMLSSKQFQTRVQGSRSQLLGSTSVSENHTQSQSEICRDCVILDAGYKAVDADFSPVEGTVTTQAPLEITKSLQDFRRDYSDITKLAFVIMRFGSTDAHSKILSSIRETLKPHGMIALRADDKEYHEELYYNILTYIYGCQFGIAAFERIETQDFNPNISLEVGYMLGMGKSVCLLKERTLQSLHTDLAGKLYRPFDMQRISKTLPPVLLKWMTEKGFIAPK
jgi:hypothetical protein